MKCLSKRVAREGVSCNIYKFGYVQLETKGIDALTSKKKGRPSMKDKKEALLQLKALSKRYKQKLNVCKWRTPT